MEGTAEQGIGGALRANSVFDQQMVAMSYQFVNHSNQVRVSCCGGTVRRGCSSSQASLSKILRTISAFQPYGSIMERDLDAKLGEDLRRGHRGFGFDLNLRLCNSVTEGEVSDVRTVGDSGVSACRAGEKVSPAAVEKSSEGECESKTHRRPIGVEITNLQVLRESKRTDEAENRKIAPRERETEQQEEKAVEPFYENDFRSEGYIGLLIEAAKLISGDFGETEPSETETEERKKEEEEESSRRGGKLVSREPGRPMRTESRKRVRDEGGRMVGLYGEELGGEEDEEKSPVVRSKRGRSQVLPNRFRDSVLDPWKPLSRLRHNPVPTRRRSRRSHPSW